MNFGKIALYSLTGVVSYFTLTAGIYMPFVIKEAKKTYRDNCDYLMILGGDIIGADTPSPQLLERMKEAVRYLRENTTCQIIPCGGCFRDGQKKSEAQIIAEYLIENEICESRIILEDRSTTTFENFEFAFRIIEEHAGKDINSLKTAFLSSSYHIFRSTIIAKSCGLKNPLKVTAKTPGEAFKRFSREYFVGYDLIYRRITKKHISQK